MSYNIGILGFGFVGQAVANAFRPYNNRVWTVDPILGNDISLLYDKNRTPDKLIDFVFVCVPTPSLDSGEIDARIVQKCTDDILRNTSATVIIKSTVTPGLIPTSSRVVYNPEFLTEANAEEDFINAEYHILGGDPAACGDVMELYRVQSNLLHKDFIVMTKQEASLVKYATNAFLATKVTFFNQLYDLANRCGADYQIIVDTVTNDKRIGEGHTKVGDRGRKRGYGGACLPKDVNALFHFSKKKFSLLRFVDRINNKYRRLYAPDERERGNNIKYHT